MLKPFSFRLNKQTDADVIEHLEKQENKRKYLIGLIKKDIQEQNK